MGAYGLYHVVLQDLPQKRCAWDFFWFLFYFLHRDLKTGGRFWPILAPFKAAFTKTAFPTCFRFSHMFYAYKHVINRAKSGGEYLTTPNAANPKWPNCPFWHRSEQNSFKAVRLSYPHPTKTVHNDYG